jgi:hypothetical protein
VPCAVAGLVLASALHAGAVPQNKKKNNGPEVFNARASVGTAAGGGDAYVTIRVDQYSAPKDIEKMDSALKTGGSAAFVQALKGSPIAGRFEVGSRTASIRYAKQVESEKSRVITLVIDTPVYFIGGGVPDAKPREGYDVAVVQLTMDPSGVGEGRMAVAAKVKPGTDGPDVDAYEGKPITLRSVMRKIS